MGVRGYTDLLANLYTLEQLVKQIHVFHFLMYFLNYFGRLFNKYKKIKVGEMFYD